MKNHLKTYHLTPSQAVVLGVLEEGNGLTASGIGKRLGLDNASVSGVLDHLSESSWITKENDENDRRAQRIFLPEHTDDNLVSTIYKEPRQANEETLQGLPWKRGFF